jgi:hypothetical protein
MNKAVQNILNSYHTTEAQLKAISKLSEDIDFAKDVLKGKYKYCATCDDYYLTKSFIHESECKEGKILIYEDPINSGGNTYTDGYIYSTYEICPKGHKVEIERSEEGRKRKE